MPKAVCVVLSNVCESCVTFFLPRMRTLETGHGCPCYSATIYVEQNSVCMCVCVSVCGKGSATDSCKNTPECVL